MTGELGYPLCNLMTTQSRSLKQYLRYQYGVHTQKAIDVFGKELDHLARFTNHHHFNLRCYNSGIVPPSLKIKAPVNSERARAAAARASRIFTQERVKSSWRARQSALGSVEGCRENLRATLSSEDLEKVTGSASAQLNRPSRNSKSGRW